jgi:hypothetical protein
MASVGEKPLDFSPPTLSEVAQRIGTTDIRRCGTWCQVWFDAGYTAETAIDKIYAVYGGQTSATNINNGLKRDKKDGTLNPNFRT